ncbi:MAG: ABC transporter permease [Eubacteriales bacterium]|nr:ABC transporter permease [Eubacteriales bacterium]
MSRKRNLREKEESFFSQTVERFARHRIAMVALAVLMIEILAVVFLPMVITLDPYTSNAGNFSKGPSGEFILGTDAVGRDVFARLIYGGRVSLAVGFFSALLSAAVGVPLGLLAGYYGGVIRMVIMRLVDIFMSFPSLVIQLVMVSILSASIPSLIFVIGLLNWTSFARYTYSKVISIKEQDFVTAAKATGATSFTQMVRYILPNSMSPLFVSFSYSMASAILQESCLSFLGLGVQLPTSTWGNMIYAAQSLSVLVTMPWLWIPPGIALIITVLSINFIGDGLRDALDPKMKI